MSVAAASGSVRRTVEVTRERDQLQRRLRDGHAPDRALLDEAQSGARLLERAAGTAYAAPALASGQRWIALELPD